MGARVAAHSQPKRGARHGHFPRLPKQKRAQRRQFLLSLQHKYQQLPHETHSHPCTPARRAGRTSPNRRKGNPQRQDEALHPLPYRSPRQLRHLRHIPCRLSPARIRRQPAQLDIHQAVAQRDSHPRQPHFRMPQWRKQLVLGQPYPAPIAV